MRSILAIAICLLAAFSFYCNADEKLVATSADSNVDAWLLIADPPKLERITELLPYTVNLTLAYNGTEQPYATPEAVFIVTISTSNSLTVALSTNRIEFTREDIVEGNNISLTVTGQVIGYVDLIFVMDIVLRNTKNDSADDVVETVTKFPHYLVTVIRASETLDNIFTMYIYYPQLMLIKY